MIASLDGLATVAASRKRTDVDVCLGVHGNTNNPFGFIGNPIGPMDMCKYCVCFRYFFWGLHLATFFWQKPN